MITIDQAINRIAEKTYENTRDINRKNLQRRHQVVDLYGVEYTRMGDANSPADIFISISPDMEYIERFQFKLIIGSFASSIGSLSGGVSGDTGDTSLTAGGEATATVIDPVESTYNISFSDGGVTPNPHSHSLDNIQISATPGITKTFVPTSAVFHVIVFDPYTDPDASNGVDITAYLAAQYGNSWIAGQGVYPSLKIDEDYDILQVACDAEGLGRTALRKLLTDPGYKGFRITCDYPFSVTWVNYLKYSHVNR